VWRKGRFIVALGLAALAVACNEPDDPSTLQGVAVTDTGWIAVGAHGHGQPLAFVSSDGRRWERLDVPATAGGLYDVAFGNGTIVAPATGQGHIQVATRKPDGAWQLVPLGTNDFQVLFGNGVFLTTAGAQPGAAVSADGLTWTPADQVLGTWFGFDGERFLSFLDPDFRTSVDGLTWSDPLAPSVHLFAMMALATVGDQVLGFGNRDCDTSAGGHCVVAQLLGPRGSDPSMLDVTSSPWGPPFSAGLALSPIPIATDGARVVVISQTILIHTTPLPVGSAPWTTIDALSLGWFLWDLSYRSGTFVAVGRKNADGHAVVVTSPDGLEWTEAPLP